MDSDVVDAASSPRLMSSPVSSSTAPRGESPPASPPVSAATSPPPSPPPSAPALFSRTFLSHPVFSQLPGDSQIRRLVGRLRQTNRVRAQAQLCSAIAAHFFTACSYDTALIFYTFDEQLSVETGMEAIDVLIPIRRQGECLCELGEYEDAVKQLQRCESVLQSLGSGTSAKKRHRLQQEVLICRGTAWLSWSDDAQTPAHESRKRVVKAQQCYQMALSLAQQLCGTGKKAKRSKGDAEMLAGSYENLGTAVVQLLYFDNVELDNRRRQHSTNSNNDTLIIDDSTTQPSAHWILRRTIRSLPRHTRSTRFRQLR